MEKYLSEKYIKSFSFRYKTKTKHFKDSRAIKIDANSQIKFYKKNTILIKLLFSEFTLSRTFSIYFSKSSKK